MSQQVRLVRLKRTGRDGEPTWAYRYRVGGRGSKRVQRGGFASERDAAEALERELERLRREQRVARSLTKAAAKQEKTRSPLPDSNRRPPPYHALRMASSRNRRQRFGLIFAGSAPIPFATDCHRLQPRGSTKAPSSVVRPGDGCVRSPELVASAASQCLGRPLSVAVLVVARKSCETLDWPRHRLR